MQAEPIEVFAVRRADGTLLRNKDTRRGAPRIWRRRDYAEKTIEHQPNGGSLKVEPMLLVPRRVRVRAGSRYYPPKIG